MPLARSTMGLLSRVGSAVDLGRLQDGREVLERCHPIRSNGCEHDARCLGSVSGSDAFPPRGRPRRAFTTALTGSPVRLRTAAAPVAQGAT